LSHLYSAYISTWPSGFSWVCLGNDSILFHIPVYREGLCLPASLEMADIFIESPAAYSIRYGDRDIDSAFLKVSPFKKRPRLLFLMADRMSLYPSRLPPPCRFKWSDHRVYWVPGFLSSRPNWVPHPLTHKQVLLPTLGPKGETHSLEGKGVGDPIRTPRQKPWCSVYYNPCTGRTILLRT
jgi:hypothetical protein